MEHQKFFAAIDKVRVKYEMLRAHALDWLSVVAAEERHGYSRASFYLAQHAFEAAGMAGLLDERPGRRVPVKVSVEVLAFLRARLRERPALSGAELARDVERVLGVRLHRRTVERALHAQGISVSDGFFTSCNAGPTFVSFRVEVEAARTACGVARPQSVPAPGGRPRRGTGTEATSSPSPRPVH